MHLRVHGRGHGGGNASLRCGEKTATNRRTALNHLRRYLLLTTGSCRLDVRQIDYRLMQGFEGYLLSGGWVPSGGQPVGGDAGSGGKRPAERPAVSRNSVSLYLRSLSSLYTLVISHLRIKDKRPFSGVFRGNAAAKRGRSLTEDEMARVVGYCRKAYPARRSGQQLPTTASSAHSQLQPSSAAGQGLASDAVGQGQAPASVEVGLQSAGSEAAGSCAKAWRSLSRQERERLALHLFLLSFYLCGMPHIDLLHLRRSQVDLSLRRLSYQRRKTGEGTQLYLCGEAMAILLLYINKDMRPDDFVFPVMGMGDSYRHYQAVLASCNRVLRRIGSRLGLHIPLTTYVARHSWAGIASHAYGIPASVISLGLAHKSESTTRRHYIDRADYADLRMAQATLMKGFRKKCGKAVTAA